MTRAQYLLDPWLALLAVALIAGCGADESKLYPVQGIVTLDGQPLTTGTIVTTLDGGRGARGEINNSGRFILETASLGPGAESGIHQVALVAYASDGSPDPEGTSKSLVPTHYNYPVSSGLTIEVGPDSIQAVELKLSSKK